MKTWKPEIFEVFTDGVSSALEPEVILNSQLAWATNVRLRGGKPHTRQPLVQRMELPAGRLQGGEAFSIQNGMLVLSIAGKIYRVDVTDRAFAVSEIAADLEQSTIRQQVWMCETAGNLVIQDGETDPIIYDGSLARRADRSKSEVPLGRQMAYGNGRLWLVINDNEIIAGDIKVKAAQSELVFKETSYFIGGGSRFFPKKITAIRFVPDSGLLVFGKFYAEMVRADIASRDLWDSFPKFVANALGATGAAGQASIVDVNKDLYWRDADGGIRSFSSALADEQSGGSLPLSEDMRRLLDHEGKHLLEYASSIYFGNRMLTTANPFYNKFGGVSFRNIVALDFAPLANREGKVRPSFDGQWNGINVTKLISGEFAGVKRAFAISTDEDGKNRLWEFVTDEIDDRSLAVTSKVRSSIEFKRRDWDAPHIRKKLVRCDVYLSEIEGPVTLDVYWRVENDPMWNKLDSVAVEAKMTYPVEDPFRVRILSPQHRTQLRSFTAQAEFDPISKRAKHVGVEFQLKLEWTGKLKIHRTVAWTDFDIGQDAVANRQEFDSTPVFQDVTNGETSYNVPLS